jgi:hypothetical protein
LEVYLDPQITDATISSLLYASAPLFAARSKKHESQTDLNISMKNSVLNDLILTCPEIKRNLPANSSPQIQARSGNRDAVRESVAQTCIEIVNVKFGLKELRDARSDTERKFPQSPLPEVRDCGFVLERKRS